MESSLIVFTNPIGFSELKVYSVSNASVIRLFHMVYKFYSIKKIFVLLFRLMSKKLNLDIFVNCFNFFSPSNFTYNMQVQLIHNVVMQCTIGLTWIVCFTIENLITDVKSYKWETAMGIIFVLKRLCPNPCGKIKHLNTNYLQILKPNQFTTWITYTDTIFQAST